MTIQSIRVAMCGFLLLATLLLATPHAHANELAPLKPLQLRGTYHMTLTGIPVVKLWMAAEDGPAAYTFTANLKSRGVVRWFKRVKSLLVSRGVLAGHGWQSTDVTIDSIYPDETKKTMLRYSQFGELLERSLSKEDDPEYRPPVPVEQLAKAPNYGDALFVWRDKLYAALREGHSQFETPLYDGKRLMRIKVQIDGKQDYALYDETVATYKLMVSRELVAGFTEKEKLRYAEGEPPLYVFARASDYLPVALEIELPFGLFKALWTQE